MAVMTWNEKLSVGVGAMDAQHQQLLGICNELHDAMSSGGSGAMLGATLDRLAAYTKTHFADEEKLLSRHSYAGLAEQQKLHADIVKQLDDLRREHREGKAAVSIKTIDFVRKWIVGHIQGVDARYGSFLQGKGVR